MTTDVKDANKFKLVNIRTKELIDTFDNFNKASERRKDLHKEGVYTTIDPIWEKK